jgi:hypothetical protein
MSIESNVLGEVATNSRNLDSFSSSLPITKHRDLSDSESHALSPRCATRIDCGCASLFLAALTSRPPAITNVHHARKSIGLISVLCGTINIERPQHPVFAKKRLKILAAISLWPINHVCTSFSYFQIHLPRLKALFSGIDPHPLSQIISRLQRTRNWRPLRWLSAKGQEVRLVVFLH